MSLFDLSGKRALITGSGSGIGFALARGLAEAGATVILNGREVRKLQRAAGLLIEDGYDVEIAAFDVTKPKVVTAEIEKLAAEKPIDILINNAGIQRRTPLEDFEAATWRELMETNLDSAFYVGQAVARVMIKQKSGAIINICSVQSEMGRPAIAPYAASKGALKMLTKGMAIDWGKHGIRVNGLAPGYFKTDLNSALVADETFSSWLINRTPLKRWGDCEELVGAAVFLASPASSFVTGHVLYVDGGVTAQL
jgi:gluconate 5-dehydrogenase